ncbi:hypothetical protein Mal64_38040 [Pseudobythopirellula maris]|uniref:Uncharacterized protein n=1 Tax=Pseudobythopirellula maris TaxID=2527991 RepID=A0A5C5ZFW3_9BACT|nr:hypothetical protein [Pseudobythopirellula maris]TWT86264.1 hypothetical protein Mal64_38040 [Pseudobythopirellula maris]
MTLEKPRIFPVSDAPRSLDEPDWEFFLPDDEEPFPEPGDFWFDDDFDDDLDRAA